MKTYLKKIIFSIITISLFFISCKVKKQIRDSDVITKQLSSQLSEEKQKSANLTRQIVDSSKTTYKDSTLISVIEQENVEYDYPDPPAGSPAKIIRRTEKTSKFSNGTNVVDQNSIKTIANADMGSNVKRNGTQIIKSNENHQLINTITSTPIYWVWILIAAICAIGIYLIKRFNVFSMITTMIAKIV